MGTREVSSRRPRWPNSPVLVVGRAPLRALRSARAAWRGRHGRGLSGARPGLGRDVAIKILPRLFTTDPERRARFDREARLLASLNHPHIGGIYGLEVMDGTPALVLELVDGDTLDERIARGPIAIDEALNIAHQIAEALEAAHEQASFTAI